MNALYSGVPNADLDALIERARKAAHDAPMNIYHVDHDGHRWVEITSHAWAQRSREYGDLLAERKRRDGR